MEKIKGFIDRQDLVQALSRELDKTTILESPSRELGDRLQDEFRRKSLFTLLFFVRGEIFERIVVDDNPDQADEDLDHLELNRALLEHYARSLRPEDLDTLATDVGLLALERARLGYAGERLEQRLSQGLPVEERVFGRREETRGDIADALAMVFEESGPLYRRQLPPDAAWLLKMLRKMPEAVASGSDPEEDGDEDDGENEGDAGRFPDIRWK